jgi:hypothetical protein
MSYRSYGRYYLTQQRFTCLLRHLWTNQSDPKKLYAEEGRSNAVRKGRCHRSVCPVENVLGRVPLIQCYQNGNSANIIPHNLRGKIPTEAAADSRPDSGTGSRLFEINMWMWRYGRTATFPRQFSVEQAVKMRKKRVQESRARGAETLRRRNMEVHAKQAAAPQLIPLVFAYSTRYRMLHRSQYCVNGVNFDIEYTNVDHRYRSYKLRYQWPQILNLDIEACKLHFDIEKLRYRSSFLPSISKYKPPISKVYLISKFPISKLDFDIKGLKFVLGSPMGGLVHWSIWSFRLISIPGKQGSRWSLSAWQTDSVCVSHGKCECVSWRPVIWPAGASLATSVNSALLILTNYWLILQNTNLSNFWLIFD